MNDTCGIALGKDNRALNGRAICGALSVDWVDVYSEQGDRIRVYLCAKHLHHRETIIAIHGGIKGPFDPVDIGEVEIKYHD